MDIYCLESFKEHMEEVDTERLIAHIEGIMTHTLESGLPIEKEEKVSGTGCVYVINVGQGNTIKLVENVFSSSIEYRLLVNNIQVDWLIDQDFRKDFIDKVVGAGFEILNIGSGLVEVCGKTFEVCVDGKLKYQRLFIKKIENA